MKRVVPILSMSSMAAFWLSCWVPSSMVMVSCRLPEMVMPWASVIFLASTMSTFSSMAMQSGRVRHIGSMFLVASPQTKKEDGTFRSRMEAKNFE